MELKYKDKVRVKSGFYEWVEGEVKEESCISWYVISIESKYIREYKDNLEKI